MMARSGCRGWSSVRKVVEKIKTLWFRSGELLRSMSGRRKLSRRRVTGFKTARPIQGLETQVEVAVYGMRLE